MESICRTKDWECPLIKQDKDICIRTCEKLKLFQSQLARQRSFQTNDSTPPSILYSKNKSE